MGVVARQRDGRLWDIMASRGLQGQYTITTTDTQGDIAETQVKHITKDAGQGGAAHELLVRAVVACT